MRVVDLIRRKRDGAELSREEIEFLIAGYTREEIPDYQMAAWLMAVFIRGMSGAELSTLTQAMLHSGKVLDFSDLKPQHPDTKKTIRGLVDKHSTGGVGDKTSLIIAPIVAAGGLVVPMISGRGLGHSGGTLDKLESISGFRVNLSEGEFRHCLRACGCGLIGQTAEIAPADKKIYALRDVIGTVESPNLICASIMSKKLAEGIEALVLDVKTGSGAFMKKEEDAAHLAGLMVETGKSMGKKVVALITDMNQPLGRAAGNALEVAECVDVLRGGGPPDLRELCLELAAWMFYLGERTANLADGKKLAGEQIASGAGLRKFREIVMLQGGDPRQIDDPNRLPHAKYTLELRSYAAGYLGATNCEKLGIACVVLGGGREKKEDTIDPAVGIVFHKRIGDAVQKDEPLCTIHYNAEARMEQARRMILEAMPIEASKVAPEKLPKLVYRVLGAE